VEVIHFDGKGKGAERTSAQSTLPYVLCSVLQKANAAEKTQPIHLHIISGKLDLSGLEWSLRFVPFSTKGIRVMKRVFFLAGMGLLLSSLAGCNSGWPSLFCNNNNDCYEVIEGGECCESSAYYAPSSPAVEYVPSPARSRVDELPMPGPDRSST
jgi:hypothetical protein